ncbi:YwpF-like family protein [Sediminibacillus massiliensis]|uniref:YwpF-like family protein n=1 Tax=Sediminibacillus massiliensis TaxID=1926277 RepID=UPI00098865D8|nr:YwpF-like family protein [Sediminibacillus massiliensis]
MKTFKLISLDVLEDRKEDIQQKNIPLLDGLIINREDEKNQWMLEAYLDHSYKPYFDELSDKKDKLMLQAKITKPSNQPATFVATIVEVNDLENKHMNVLFIGTLVDLQRDQIEKTLQALIEEGYQGDELLDAFKDRM